MIMIDENDYLLRGQEVECMSDEEFKRCIATLFNIKYYQAKQMTIDCYKRESCSKNDETEIDVDLTVKY